MKKIVITIFLMAWVSILKADIQLGFEGGGVWQLRNDLQRPQNTTATRLALDEIDSGPFSYYRVEAYIRPSDKHGFRFLYAPLTIEVKNTPTSAIRYNEQSFVAGSEVKYTYQFNSYRLTYFYALNGQSEKQFNIGFTAKIRDAETKLSQEASSSQTSYDNVGFVPLLFLEYQRPVFSHWLFHFSFDGLAGGPGRAFDFAFKLRRKLGSLGQIGFGYRVLEGGVDNDKVYNFALLSFALVEWVVSF
jgi:hypothetical protein